MAEHLPSAQLATETAPQQSLSIRCLSDGLTFCVRSLQQPVEVLAQGFLPFSPAVGESLQDKLLDLFYTYDFLGYPYQRTIYYDTPREAVLVPTELVQAGQEGIWLFAGIEEGTLGRLTDAASTYFSTPLPEETKSLVAKTDQALIQLLRRTLLVVEMRPASFPALTQRLEESRGFLASELLVLLVGKELVILAHRRGEVFSYRQVSLQALESDQAVAEEVLFYLFAQWQHLELSGTKDRIALGRLACGATAEEAYEQRVFSQLEALLAPYIETIIPFVYTPC